MFLPINLDNLGMNTPEVARFWSIGIIIIVHLMLFLIGFEILKSKKKALLINILFLVWQPFFEGWTLWIDSFLPIFLLSSFYALLKKQFIIAGLLIGFGIVFKQVLIPLSVFIAAYLFIKEGRFKTTKFFSLGLLIPVSLMILYFAVIDVLKEFWFWTVAFNLTTYANYGRGMGPTSAHLIRVLFVFGIAFVLLALSKFKTKETLLLLIFLIGALLGLTTRFDFIHFQPALPFALIATVYGVFKLKGLKRLFCTSVYLMILVWWMTTFYKGHMGNRVIAFDADTLNIAGKIKSHTTPQEKIFVFGAAPHLYQMSNTLPAGDIFVFQFPWFLKVAENKILTGLMKDKPNIIISDRTVTIEGAKIIDFAKNIDQYINKYYEKVDSVGTVDILRRNSKI